MRGIKHGQTKRERERKLEGGRDLVGEKWLRSKRIQNSSEENEAVKSCIITRCIFIVSSVKFGFDGGLCT